MRMIILATLSLYSRLAYFTKKIAVIDSERISVDLLNVIVRIHLKSNEQTQSYQYPNVNPVDLFQLFIVELDLKR